LVNEERSRGWTWSALVVGVLICLAAVPTWGLSIALAPIGAVLTLAAMRWSRHDGLFWVAFAFNGINVLMLLSYVAAWLNGDLGVGLE
jgi:hypothetical protein